MYREMLTGILNRWYYLKNTRLQVIFFVVLGFHPSILTRYYKSDVLILNLRMYINNTAKVRYKMIDSLNVKENIS